VIYRDLAEMMAERGAHVAHSTILRWLLSYVPEYVKRWDRHRRAVGCPWRADETNLLVKAHWRRLYRAVDKRGRSVDYYVSPRRDIGAATAVVRKALASHHGKPPSKITLDGNPATRRALWLLRRRNGTWRRVIVGSAVSGGYRPGTQA
jgi:transposase-like protein